MASKLDDLATLIPEAAKARLVPTQDGNEVVIPYPEVLQVIQIATQNSIAVLGVELLQILGKGEFRVLNYSGYEFKLEGDWESFVAANNEEAGRFVEEHVLGEEHGYILTSTSKREFDALARWKGIGPFPNP